MITGMSQTRDFYYTSQNSKHPFSLFHLRFVIIILFEECDDVPHLLVLARPRNGHMASLPDVYIAEYGLQVTGYKHPGCFVVLFRVCVRSSYGTWLCGVDDRRCVYQALNKKGLTSKVLGLPGSTKLRHSRFQEIKKYPKTRDAQAYFQVGAPASPNPPVNNSSPGVLSNIFVYVLSTKVQNQKVSSHLIPSQI